MASKKDKLKNLKNGEKDFSKTVLPKENQFLGIVEKRLGGGRMRVKTIDGRELLARVPGRVKKYLWVRENDIVLLEPWEYDKSKADLLYKYKSNEVKYLEKKGYNVDFEIYEEF